MPISATQGTDRSSRTRQPRTWSPGAPQLTTSGMQATTQHAPECQPSSSSPTTTISLPTRCAEPMAAVCTTASLATHSTSLQPPISRCGPRPELYPLARHMWSGPALEVPTAPLSSAVEASPQSSRTQRWVRRTRGSNTTRLNLMRTPEGWLSSRTTPTSLPSSGEAGCHLAAPIRSASALLILELRLGLDLSWEV